MPRVHYRQAIRSDSVAMARLWTESGGEGGAHADRMARYPAGEYHPQQALIPRVVYVACDGGAVAGYVAGHLTRRYACDGELQWILVDPEHRGTGVASELLRAFAGWFAEQHARRICVNVDPANTPARRFYTRHGAGRLNEHWLVWNDITVVP